MLLFHIFTGRQTGELFEAAGKIDIVRVAAFFRNILAGDAATAEIVHKLLPGKVGGLQGVVSCEDGDV